MVLSAALALVSGGICYHSAGSLSMFSESGNPGSMRGAVEQLGSLLERPTIPPPEDGSGIAQSERGGEEDAAGDGEEDTRCIHEFQETWVGYECKLTDYNPDYFPGDEVKITATFGKKVGSQIGMNRQGEWYTVAGDKRKVETVVTPDNDYLNIQVTDLMGLTSVNLADIQVEITKKAEEDNTPYLHRFLGPWEGFETKFSDYNPDYAPGDQVKVSIRFKKEVGSQIGANIAGAWTSLTGEGTELVQTFLPDNDYLNVQITDMKGNYTVGILSVDVEITEKGNGVPGGGDGSLMPTKYGEPGDYQLFSGGFNEGYGTNDGWLLECEDSDWLTLTYDCGLEGQENWGVLGWGATVDGEWVDGPGYSADSNVSTKETSLNFTVKYLRRMMGITKDSNLSYYSLGAWSEGRIVGLTLHVGSDIPRSDRLFTNGAPNESWVCQDIEQILDEPDDRYICVQYTCATPDYEGWTVLGWGASVNGEWQDGKSYKTSTKEAARDHFASMPMDAFRDMLHLSWDNKVDSIKLSAFNDGRILDLWLSDTKVEDPGNSKKDKVVAEAPYTNPNHNVYGSVAGGGSSGTGGGGSGGSGGSGSGSRTSYDIEQELDEWGWNYPDSSIQKAIIRGIKKGTFLVVDYDTDGEKPPKLNFKTSQGTEAEVLPNWWKDGKAVYSYHAIASALSGYLIPNEISEIGIGAQGEPMTVYTIEVVKATDAELTDEPIAVLKKSWEGFTTPISKYNSSYQVGDTVTITVTFDKRCEAAVAFTLNGEWSAPYQKGDVISRTVRPENDSMTISLGQMTQSMRYVMIKDIQVEVEGKLNYDKAVLQDGEKAALLACSTKAAAQAAGLTDAMVIAGTKLVIHTEEATLDADGQELARQAAGGIAGLENMMFADAGVDIVLEMRSGDGTRTKLHEIPGPMPFKIPVPEGIDTETNDFAMVRLHEGQVELLPDLDDEPDTITFASSMFSRFGVVYGPTGTFDILTGETSLYTFRSAWSGYETEIGSFLPEYEVGDEVKITAVFDRDTKSQIVVGGDWDHVTEAEGSTLTVTATPKEDKINIQIQDMKGERVVKLKSLTAVVTKKYDDGTGVHVFRGTWQGFEAPLSSWLESGVSFQPGAETEVTMVFDREVTAQAAFGVEGSSWYPLSGTGKEITLTVLPLEDKINIQITDLLGNAAVKLTELKVRQEETEVPALYTFTQNQKEFAFDILEYCPEYKTGDTVKIVAELSSDAYFNGRIGVNDVDGVWTEQYLESSGGEDVLHMEWEIAPATDGEGKPAQPGFQLWTVNSQAGVRLESLTVETVAAEEEAVFTFTQTEKDFVFDILEYCPEYKAGDTVKIVAELSSDAYFNGRIGVDDVNGVWTEQYLESSGGEESLRMEWEIAPAADGEGKPSQPGFQLWTVNSQAGVRLESLTVETVAVEGPVFTFTPDQTEFAFNILDYCPEYKTGDTVRIQAVLSSDAYFNGRIGGNVQNKGWQQESFEYQNGTAEVEWVIIPDGEPSFGLWSIDSEVGVILESLTVETVVVEEPVFTFTPDQTEFSFDVLDYCPGYEAGDMVRIQALLSSDAYFNGRIGGNVQNEGWQQEYFEYQDGTAEVEWVVIPDGEPGFGLWTIDSETGVTLEWLNVELAEPDNQLLASASNAALPYGYSDEILDEDASYDLTEEEEYETDEDSDSSEAVKDTPVWKEEEDAGGETDDDKAQEAVDDEDAAENEQLDEDVVNEKPVDEETVDEEPVGEETADEETADEEPVGEETADKEPVDKETADEGTVDRDVFSDEIIEKAAAGGSASGRKEE